MSCGDNPEASPWERCLADFLRSTHSLSGGSSSTLFIYASRLHLFFCTSAHGGPPKHPEAYTREDVEDFIHQPSLSTRSRGLPPSISTINQRLMSISVFYRYAAGYYLAVPGDGKLCPLLSGNAPTAGMRYGRPRGSHRSLTDVEMERFFAVIPTDTVRGLRDRAIFLMYFWSARRRSEIQRLTWGDLSQGVIVDEQGHRREGWLYHFTGKGKSGEVDIAELPAPAKVALDAYLSASGRLATMRPEDPLFLSIGPYASRGRALTGQAMSVVLKSYARAAGLDPRLLSLHSWRHTATQLRYAAGEDIRSLQRLLRHESLQTTDTYLRGLMSSADNGALLLVERFGHLSNS